MKHRRPKLLPVLLTLGFICTVLMACRSKKDEQQQSKEATYELKVMTFNMRYDNPEDGANNWKYRTDSIQKLLETEAPDIIGGQEVLKNMLDDLQRLAPNYTYLGVGREDGVDKGEYSPILYRADKYACIDDGYFWLRPDSLKDQPGFGWDAACERIATWAILRDQESKQEFFFINTHLDHRGQEARRESTAMLKEAVKLYSKGLPTIMTGDFNADPTTSVYAAMVDSKGEIQLSDARTIAQEVSGPNWTFHDFGQLPIDRRTIIDYIFVSKEITVERVKVIADPEGATVYTSDHTPMVAHLSFPIEKQ